MESLVYKLVKPYEIHELKEERVLQEGWVAIEPTMGSICHADLRYFTGNRKPEALKKKLPMAILHEGIGIVKESKDANYKAGDRVVVVPNIPARLFGEEQNESDNYSLKGKFMGSGYDGVSQSLVVHPGECLVKIPDTLSDEFAVLAELNSVSVRAMRKVADRIKQPGTKVAVFGDGPVGYLTASYIRYGLGVSEENLFVFGADQQKLSQVRFAQTRDVRIFDFTTMENQFDVVVECTGAKFSESAINQGIDCIKREGDLVLMGVSEERVPINTRDVLEKGLTLYGSSRSTVDDFTTFVSLVNASQGYKEALEKILPEKIDVVENGNDFKNAMDKCASTPRWNKVIVQFKWQNT